MRTARMAMPLAGILLALSPGGPATAGPPHARGTLPDPAQLSVAGAASVADGAVRLTDGGLWQAGAVWDKRPVSLAGKYETSARLQLSAKSGRADGIVFALQTAGTNAVGRPGIDLGFGGITPSVGVEFDIFKNNFDPDANHVGVIVNGEVGSHVKTADPGFDLTAGEFSTWITYQAATRTVEVYVSRSRTRPAAPVLRTETPASSGFLTGNVYAGFTAGTGTESAVHEVRDWTAGNPRRGYVALGDSYASGEGAAEQYFKTYTDRTGKSSSMPDPDSGGRTTTGCHRSVSSWAYGVFAAAKERRLADDMTFTACSAAKATDVFNTNRTYTKAGAAAEAPQIDAVNRTTTLASLSIGGNDANFADIVKKCTSGFKAGSYDCRKKGAAPKLAQEGLDRLRSSGLNVPRPTSTSTTWLSNGDRMHLNQIYSNIARAMAPGGLLIVTGYPRLFGEAKSRYDRNGTIRTCRVGTMTGVSDYRIKYEDAQWLNELADEVNRVIQANVSSANRYLQGQGSPTSVAFASTSAKFDGHRICSGDKWFNGVQFVTDPRALKQKQTSMHPSLEGQLAYCRAAVSPLPLGPDDPHGRCSFNRKAAAYE